MTTYDNSMQLSLFLFLLVVLVLVLSFPSVHKYMLSYDRQNLFDLTFNVYSAPAPTVTHSCIHILIYYYHQITIVTNLSWILLTFLFTV